MAADSRSDRISNTPNSLAGWRADLLRRPALLLAAYAVLLAIPTCLLQRTSAHTTSRLATIDSLVSRGTFAIDGSIYFDTVDKVKIGPHYYSHQPPGHSLLASILYFPLYHLGIRFTPGKNYAVPILTLLTNGLSALLGLVLLFRALSWWDLSWELRLCITTVTGCGTLLLPYSTTLNVHGFVAAWLFFGFYLLVSSATAKSSNLLVFLAGLAFSLCASVDHATAAFYASFGLDLLLRPERRKQVIWFLLPACLTVAPTLVYYFVISGSIKPIAARPELFTYPGSIWAQGKEQLTGAHWNSVGFALEYGLKCLFGRGGILTYSPVLIIAIYGMARTIRRRLRFWREAVAVAAASFLMLVYYSFASTNYGGWAYGIRWFVAISFLFCFFGGAAADLLVHRKWLVASLAFVSVVYAVGGMPDPWIKLGYLGPVFRLNHYLHRLVLLH
jgi:hypothetical protein